MVSALGDALAAGVLKLPFPPDELPAQITEALAGVVAHEQYPYPPIVLYLAVYGWTRIHGMVMLELFENTQPILGDAEAFFRFEMERMCAEFGLYPKS